MQTTYTLYVHIFPNNKMYIGITCTATNKRWGIDGFGYKSQRLMWRAIQKYGWDNIKHIILLENLSKEMACECEKYLIAKYKTNNHKYGYNIYVGGDVGNSGVGLSQEQREYLRQINLGKKLSEETKRKISESHKGYKQTASHIEHARQAHIGRKFTDEQKKHLSDVHKGHVASIEQRNKQSKSLKRYIQSLSEEEKQKRFSNLNKRKTVSVNLYYNNNFIKQFNTCRECAEYLNISPAYVCVIISKNQQYKNYRIVKTTDV